MDSGMGWLMAQPKRQVAMESEYRRNITQIVPTYATVREIPSEGKVEFLIILTAGSMRRMDGNPLN